MFQFIILTLMMQLLQHFLTLSRRLGVPMMKIASSLSLKGRKLRRQRKARSWRLEFWKKSQNICYGHLSGATTFDINLIFNNMGDFFFPHLGENILLYNEKKEDETGKPPQRPRKKGRKCTSYCWISWRFCWKIQWWIKKKGDSICILWGMPSYPFL